MLMKGRVGYLEIRIIQEKNKSEKQQNMIGSVFNETC